MILAGLILVAALAQSPSNDAVQAPAAIVPPVKVTAKLPVGDPDRVVCKYETATGSNIPSRVCHTARDWEAAQKAGRDMLNSMQEQSVHSSLKGN